ncbi:MAG TPA: arylamine N-acetyltransferase [Vicinamibacterales bacterium]|nr:arylamine N-acetyltransferase [Vicinamibacterales bacterium]
MTFNLAGYLARIGWDGRREPTPATLESVLRAHMMRVPFENLDVLLGRGVRIDLDSVYGKLVTARRGGYCFEHGTLLREALQQLGFQPVAHTARVIQLRPRSEAPLTHMFLTVQMEGKRLVLDPGFGGHSPRVPLPLTGEEVRDGDDVHRMVRQGGDWALEARIDGVPTALWSSSFEPAEPVDFVMANHFVSTFSESPFVTRLMLRALTPDARVSMMNQDVTVRDASGQRTRVMTDRADLRQLLIDHFGFDLPEVERLRVPSVPQWT